MSCELTKLLSKMWWVDRIDNFVESVEIEYILNLLALKIKQNCRIDLFLLLRNEYRYDIMKIVNL